MDPLYAFVFAGLFSPGPNVILLTASGARFGFRATLPHVFGVAVGVGVIDFNDEASWVYGDLSGSIVYTRAGIETTF